VISSGHSSVRAIPRECAARPMSGPLVAGLLVAVLLAACGTTATSTPVGSASGQADASSSPVLASSPIPALGAALSSPVGLVFDAAGSLYVSQCAYAPDSYIYRIDSRGMLTPFAGTGKLAFAGDGGLATSAEIGCPNGMAFGPDGSLFFADHANNRVRRIDTSGVVSTVAGSGPDGVDEGSFSGDGGPAIHATLKEPWDVAFDTIGNLFISDRDNNRVRRVDPNGTISTVAGTGGVGTGDDGGPAIASIVCQPLGVAVNASQDLLIADSCSHRVRKVDSRGLITTVVGTGNGGFSGDGGPATSASIEGPNDFAFDASGALLVSTALRIRRIDTAGHISTIAGSGEPGTLEDGIAAVREPFTGLAGMAFDADGNLFVADGNDSVYRIDARGIFTLFAGGHP
jgi:trimeric autotransporter adhesin